MPVRQFRCAWNADMLLSFQTEKPFGSGLQGGGNVMIIVLCLSIIAGTLLCGLAQLLEWIDRTYNDYKLLKTLERWMNP